MIKSLKTRLIWTLLGLTLFVWLASAILTIYSAGRATEQQVDRQLEQYSHLVTYISRVFARQIDEGLPLYETWGDNPLERLRERPMEVEAPELGEFRPAVNIWLGDRLIAVMAGSPQFERPTVAGFSYVDAADGGGRWRVLTRYDAVSELWIRVGVEFELARGSLLRTLARELLPLLVVLPLTVVALYLGVSSGLSPLRNLAGQIARRKPGLLEPVAMEGVPAEISDLVASVNKLMQRLAHALESEQRFTANAAHELLTPLAAIKTEVQLCQKTMRDEDDAAMLQGIVERVDRAGHSVEQLLTLARLDPDVPLPTSAVNLRDLLAETLAETGHLAAGRQLAVDLPEGDDVFVEGSESALAIMLRNLLVNAFRYASEATTVRIRVANDDGVALSICNDCRPLPSEELARVGDRFYRVPGSPGPGAGLGLSIIERIAEHHGARFAVDTSDTGTVFCATISGLRPVD
jgi:signal transduction histidine kinase